MSNWNNFSNPTIKVSLAVLVSFTKMNVKNLSLNIKRRIKTTMTPNDFIKPGIIERFILTLLIKLCNEIIRCLITWKKKLFFNYNLNALHSYQCLELRFANTWVIIANDNQLLFQINNNYVIYSVRGLQSS